MRRNPMCGHYGGERFDDLLASYPPFHPEREALAGVLIDQCQNLQLAPVVRERGDEIVAPDVVAMCGPEPDTRTVVKPQTPSRTLLLWYLQPFLPPDPLYPILADRPT